MKHGDHADRSAISAIVLGSDLGKNSIHERGRERNSLKPCGGRI